MKKIKSFRDVEYIIENKCDVVDAQGHKIQFVRFLGMTLLEVTNAVISKEWEYELVY